jgi:hypothetical protein
MIGSMSEFNIIAKGESPIARVFILFQVMVEWGLVSARPLMAEKRESRFQMVSRRHRAYAKMGQPL